MDIEKFIKEMDIKIKESWDVSSGKQKEANIFSEKDSYLAVVQTRQDVALNLSVNVFNAKVLSSIKLGIWALVIIEVIRSIFYFFIK